MPVWHEFTREWRESGDLLVLGIVQEQHPERAALYAQWQGFEWPILWDPFNLTQSKAVPNLWAIDEHGVVRLERPSLETFEAEFLARAFDAPPTPAEPQRPESPGAGDGRERALSIVLAGDASQLGGVIEVLTDQLAGEPGQAVAPRASFELGVALRLRHDSPAAQPGDFQAALDAWSRALAGDPAQYIWRRRLEQ